MITITVNGAQHQLDLEPDTPLLWALRDAVGLERVIVVADRGMVTKANIELLATTDLPLTEIALTTGFSDQSHFSRRFHEIVGMPPGAFRGREGEVAVYFEAAAVIIVLVLLGQVLELRARDQTSGAIRALLNFAPKTTRLIASDGSESEIPLERVVVGNHLRVRPGEKIPTDVPPGPAA